MSEIFNALPGIEVPVGSIKHRLTKMWDDTAASGGPAPQHDAAKATQVNFVVQFGLQTTVADATEQFQTAVRFSRRYPCRVVVLCPMPDDTTATEMRAKIYGECHLGKSKGDTRCCEFVMLNYPPSSRPFVENQVSICLSTDLPLYYWAHRFISSARISQFNFLLNRSKRVLLDSAITPADALTFPWPKPEAVRDLAHARLLPVRQTIGQFLSAYAPAKLIEGLSGVTLVHTPAVAACPTSAAPMVSPGPCSSASASRGRPASCSSSTKAAATAGVCSAGLAATALPATSAATTWPAKIASGKFHGEMQTKTPRPCSRSSLLSPVGPGSGSGDSRASACCA